MPRDIGPIARARLLLDYGVMLRMASLAVGLIALAACGSSQEPSAVSVRSALKTLSDSVDVEPFPMRSPSRPSSMKAACGPTQCLVVYELESEIVKGAFLYATRVDSSGHALDEPPKLLTAPPLTGPGDGAPGRISAVAAGADNTFMVAWCSVAALDDSCREEVYSTRVEADGTLTPFAARYHQEPLTSLTLAGGTGYLLLDSNGDVRKLGDYGFENSITTPMLTRAIVPGDAQFLLLGVGSVARFDPGTETVLDEQAIPVTSDGADLNGAFASNAYHLFWESPKTGGGARILGARVSPDSGQVLDPDLDETSTPGARVQIDPAPSGLQVAASEGDLLLMSPGPSSLDVWKVNGATGEAAGFRHETRWPGETTAFQLVVGGGAGLLLADAEPSTLASVTTSWGSDFGLDFGVAQPFVFRPEPRLSPFVASNGTDYAVTWRQPSGLYATRVDATSGVYTMDPKRFAELAPGSGVLRSEIHFVAWGDAYKFLFLRQSGAESALVMGDVFSGELRTLATDVGFDARGANAVCRGRYCLVAWVKNGVTPVLSGVRVEKSAVSQPFEIGRGTAAEQFSPRVVAGPNADADQAWVVFEEATAEVGESVWVRPYRFSTSYLGPPLALWSSVDAQAVQSESRLFVFWREPGDIISEFNTISVDAMSGEQSEQKFPDGAFPAPSNFDLASVWYDGVSLVGLWAGMELGTLRSAFKPQALLLRFSTDVGYILRGLDSYPGTVVSNGLPCSGASRGEGQSLIACDVFDHTSLGATIKVRRFEHDGANAFGGGMGTGGAASERGGNANSGGSGGIQGGSSGAAGAGTGGQVPSANDSKGCGCRLPSNSEGRSTLPWLGLWFPCACLFARRMRGRPRVARTAA